jgi:hypothetical protein
MSTENAERDESLLDFNNRARSADILQVAERLGARLEYLGGNEWRGPCPRCGGTGFTIDVQRRVFACRSGNVSGDVVGMVKHVLALNYAIEAATWINEPQAPQAAATDERGEA